MVSSRGCVFYSGLNTCFAHVFALTCFSDIVFNVTLNLTREAWGPSLEDLDSERARNLASTIRTGVRKIDRFHIYCDVNVAVNSNATQL